jgi:hypothetical protein
VVEHASGTAWWVPLLVGAVAAAASYLATWRSKFLYPTGVSKLRFRLENKSFPGMNQRFETLRERSLA